MSSKMTFLFGVPMFVGGCAILWFYWDRFKKSQKMKIFISADCWLCVFDLLEPSQLGLGISMISHRFNFYVDEHFKTRKWTLAITRIWNKIGENGTKKIEFFNKYWKPLPIPQIEMPRKVIRFECIEINYIDNNVIAFLRRFGPIFAACKINLAIDTTSDRILDFILHNIWPMIGKNIYVLELSPRSFRRLRQFVPSLLNECPSLCFVSFYYGGFFTEFPADDNANASNGQALAKWLFTALPNNVPKMFKCALDNDDGNWSFKIAAFKAAFANASSPANFIVVIWFPLSSAFFVVPFDQTNELTREQLALKKINNCNRFLLIRCPIARDESKWTKWEEEAIGWQIDDQWNKIDIRIYTENYIGDGLLDEIPGPSDQQ